MKLLKIVFLISKIMFFIAMLAFMIKVFPDEYLFIQIILIVVGTIAVVLEIIEIHKLFTKKDENELRGINTGNKYQIDTFDDLGNRVMSTCGTIINAIPIPKMYKEIPDSLIAIKIDGNYYIFNGDTLIIY